MVMVAIHQHYNKMVVIFFQIFILCLNVFTKNIHVVLGNDRFLKILHITCDYDIISYIKGSIYI